MGHISISPGKRPHLAQLSREVLWLSLSVSLCDSPPRLPVLLREPRIPNSCQPPAPRAISSQLKLSLLTGHAQELHKPIPPHAPVQGITATPGNPLLLGQAQSHTLVSHQGSRPGSQQATPRMLTGQNQLKAD